MSCVINALRDPSSIKERFLLVYTTTVHDLDWGYSIFLTREL